jgi:hypothetical protein
VAGEPIRDGDDFSWTVPGELVHFPTAICAGPGCGCNRAMCGFVSHKSTTVFEVRDLDMTPDAFAEFLWDSLEAEGWLTAGGMEDRAWLEEWADEHLKVAADFEPGLGLQFRDWAISVRNPYQTR